MSATLLTKVQIGRETTAGTAVAADHILRVPAAFLDDQREMEHVPEDVGYLSGVNRTNVKSYLGSIQIPHQATFEDLPYLLDMGLKGVASGAADGAGSGKIYAFAAPIDSQNTLGTYTIEGTDGQQGYRMAYGHMTELVLSGSGGNPVEANATLFGRNPEKNTAASLSLAIAEVINFSKGKLYLDAVDGTMGTTQVTGTWLDFNFTLNTGQMRQYTGDGSLDFNHTYNGGIEIMNDITVEHDANAVSAFDAFQDETPKLMRMLFQGSALTTPGTLYTYKTLMIDMAVKATKWGPIQTRDGNNIVPVTYKAAYDETAAQFATITVVNEVASL